MQNRRAGLAILTLIVMLFVAYMPMQAEAAKTYTGTIIKDNIFFRSRASTSSGWKLRFKKGAIIEILGVSGSFYKAKYNNSTGYVMQKFVSVSEADAIALGVAKTTTVANDPNMKGITKISQITVPATSKKGNTGKNVLAIQQALKIKGYYKAPINSKFDDNTVAAVKAYQKAQKLTQSGQADFATIKKLFGKNAADYKTTTPTPKKTATPTPKKTATPTPKKTATPTLAKLTTEKLTWFNTGKNLFKAGATFQVKDVKSGKVWTCKRLYAGNHLDAEPLTAADTAIMKAAYGGKINYVRRAVLVKYNGHVYAGSMYGEPHGDYSIKNNNFDGQFCIHFTGSKTSGSGVVDSAHQSMITTALKAKW